MLTKPRLEDEELASRLWSSYGLSVVELAFLPLGADRNTAVYRATARDGKAYFAKLRRGDFDKTPLVLTRLVKDEGIGQVIAPLRNKVGGLWCPLRDFTLTLFPFIEGQDAYQKPLSDRQWHDLGRALKRIHQLHLPPALKASMREEDYSDRWRDRLRELLEIVESVQLTDAVVAALVDALRTRGAEILGLIRHAQRLSSALQGRSSSFVLCHSDLHAGNVHVDGAGALFIVDWDEALLAPKERDLMFVGGGLWGQVRSPRDEEALFYGGYGHADIVSAALAYYRTERVVEDIAIFCDRILSMKEEHQDREQCLRYIRSNFSPGGTIEIARRTAALVSD